MTEPPAPKSQSRRRVVTAVVVAAAVIAAAIWFFFVRDTSPEEFSLDDAVSDAENADANAEPVDSVEGTWSVAADAGPQGAASEAGYRVEEELVNFGNKTVVGRTTDVVGAVTIEGTDVTGVTMTVDMGSIETDSSQRDGRYRSALEVDRFPTSTFTLTQPIDLGTLPEPGVHVTVTAVGELTVHGVTRSVEATLDAALAGSALVVVGSIPVAFSDYDIEKPSAAIVLSLDDEGVIEFQLYLTKS